MSKDINKKSNLTQSQLDRLAKINHVQISCAIIGAVGGLLYARKRGNGNIGGLWKGLLYAIGGTIIVTIPASFALEYMKNNIINEPATYSEANGSESEVEKE